MLQLGDQPRSRLVSYPSSISPLERDFDLDYEAVLTAVGDLNRISRYLFRGGMVNHQQDPTGQPPADRQDVVNVLDELREMLNRMFTRFPQHFR